MKKFLFTVFAVVGFSAICVANNQLDVKKIQVKIVFADCRQDQEAAFDDCMSNGCGYYESYFFGAAAWGRCMGA
ncbi:hypothetical protein [Flavobacterium tistrianum]|uniref:hypothetical protein n=1 Tax=Flavobacterium tistrianum TaxID=1685414 RepID=UPI000DABB15F|nr:hypothetical protein [Flavobacterium tistrianum]KAF2339827.1 hypothetical protein DMB71_15295 [Flavobacterium tistrianum]